MKLSGRFGRGRSELLAKKSAKLLIHRQRLRLVSSRGERLHEVSVSALAERALLNERSRAAFCRIEFRAADRQARQGRNLERAQIVNVQRLATIADPRPVVVV